MYDFATSRLRGLRLRLKYYQFFVKKKQKKSLFITDVDNNFNQYIEKLKNRNYKKIVIIGNGPNISALNDEISTQYKEDSSILTIGLNKAYLLFQTDILLWGDHVIMKDLKGEKRLPKTTFLHASQLVITTRENLKFWKEEKSFSQYNTKGLFKSRTILVSALHLAYFLDIKNIEFYGISMDSRTYFYDNILNKSMQPFEFLADKDLEEKYFGYTMQKITQEVIDYLSSIGFELHYGGESNFLYSVPGIQSLEERKEP